MTKSIDITIEKVELQYLVSLVEQGMEIIITKGEKEVGKFSPMHTSKKRILGLNKGLATVKNDFDEPLSDDFWEGKT
jgi:antitoxin (DNA-binding transcriptional repressor) of toxin-antitoxin stability system